MQFTAKSTFPGPCARRVAAASVLVFASLSAIADPAPGSLGSLLTVAVDRQHAAGRFDGVVMVSRGETEVYERAVGFADRAMRQPHRVDQPWRLASVSKQVAALLVMQQIERGRLSLETRLDTLLADFDSPLAGQITVRHLLQHTSGLPNPDASLPPDAAGDAVPPFYTAVFTDDAGPLNAALVYCAGPPSGQPGARFSYNNCDTLMVQAVLERLTGQPYAQLLQSAVAAPLGLMSLGMATPTRARETPKGYLRKGRSEPAFNLANFGASGALVGSARDLLRLDRALMRHRLLSEAATRTMWTGDPKLGYVALGAWGFKAPLAGCDQPVMLVERRGEIGGVQVRNLIAPDLGGALVVLSNTSETEFGEIWQGRGLMHEMASAAFCAPVKAPSAHPEVHAAPSAPPPSR